MLNNPLPFIKPIPIDKNEMKTEIQENLTKKSCDIAGDNSDCETNTNNKPTELLNSLLDKHKALMMTEKGCNACDDAKKIYNKSIEEGKIKEIDIDTPTGDIIDKYVNIKDTPTVLTKDKQGNIVKCFVYEDDKIYCGKGDKEFKLDTV